MKPFFSGCGGLTGLNFLPWGNSRYDDLTSSPFFVTAAQESISRLALIGQTSAITENISIGEMDNGIKLVLYWFQMRIDPILMWKLSQLKLWPLVTFYRMNSRRPQWPYYYNSMLSN